VVRRSDGAEQAASWWQEHVVEEAIHLLVDRKQRKRIQHGARTRCSPKFVPPVTCFLQLGPTSDFSPLTITPSYCEFTKGLIRGLGQSPHDLIASGNSLSETPEVLY
jgi:hypothetical protein